MKSVLGASNQACQHSFPLVESKRCVRSGYSTSKHVPYNFWMSLSLSLYVYVYIYILYLYIYINVYTSVSSKKRCARSDQTHIHQRCARLYFKKIGLMRTKCIIHNINYNPYNPYSQKHSIYYIASTHVAICKVKPMKLCLIAGKL